MVSMKLTLPVPLNAGAVAIWVKAPPFVDRWTTKPVSLLALSVQLSCTWGPPGASQSGWWGPKAQLLSLPSRSPYSKGQNFRQR